MTCMVSLNPLCDDRRSKRARINLKYYKTASFTPSLICWYHWKVGTRGIYEWPPHYSELIVQYTLKYYKHQNVSKYFKKFIFEQGNAPVHHPSLTQLTDKSIVGRAWRWQRPVLFSVTKLYIYGAFWGGNGIGSYRRSDFLSNWPSCLITAWLEHNTRILIFGYLVISFSVYPRLPSYKHITYNITFIWSL